MRMSAFAIAMGLVLAPAASAQVPPRAKAAASPSKSWTPPRTPWGDPDLQGTFTNSNEYATPLERPARFAGRTLQQITDAEIAAILKAGAAKTAKTVIHQRDAPQGGCS